MDYDEVASNVFTIEGCRVYIGPYGHLYSTKLEADGGYSFDFNQPANEQRLLEWLATGSRKAKKIYLQWLEYKSKGYK